MASVEGPISRSSDARIVDARKPLRTTTATKGHHREQWMGKLFLIGMAIAVATLIGMAVFIIQL
jgi:hypothetical protein